MSRGADVSPAHQAEGGSSGTPKSGACTAAAGEDLGERHRSSHPGNVPKSALHHRQITSLLCAFVFYPLSICICSFWHIEKFLLHVQTALTQDKSLSKLQDPMCCRNINSNCWNLQVPNLLSTRYPAWDLGGPSRGKAQDLCSALAALWERVSLGWCSLDRGLNSGFRSQKRCCSLAGEPFPSIISGKLSLLQPSKLN